MPSESPITLTIAAEPRLARLVRMTASTAAMLSHISLEHVEDVRMAAEEAFIYACSVQPGEPLTIDIAVDDARIELTFRLSGSLEPVAPDSPAAYADLIISTVCDAYEKRDDPAALILTCKADV